MEAQIIADLLDLQPVSSGVCLPEAAPADDRGGDPPGCGRRSTCLVGD